MIIKWKNRNFYIIALFCMMFGLTGCSNTGEDGKNFHNEEKLAIVTTIYPMYDFTLNIAGDKAEIINLVPAGTEPHDFELSASDMRLIEKADIFIYNGAGMEHFVDKTLAAVSNKDLVIVEAAGELDLLVTDSHHDHGREAHDENDAEEKTDPHTWLSIENAIAESEAIKETLIKLDGKNADYYEANFQVYKGKLEGLAARYKEELSDMSHDTIVVAHEAFGYLCNEYGLKQEAVEGLTADSEPDAARMKEIIEFCKENNIKIIFFEELVSPKVAETIANEIGAETMLLNPVEGLTAEQMEEGLDYIGIMEQNLEALKKALQ